MRDHSHHIALSRDDAVAQMLAASGFTTPVPDSVSFTATVDSSDMTSSSNRRPQRRLEQIPLTEAFGRVLAEDVRACTDAPNALTCSMDSIAVHWDDFENVEPGELPDTSTWVRGVDWEFANTGIAMPEGFDTAIVIEHVVVSEDEQHVEIDATPSRRFAGTRAVGSQHKRGDVIASSGSVVTPDVAASIASAGHSSVTVLAKPRVAFIPTGNELVPANLPFSEHAPEKYAGTGHVFESNSIVVRGKVEAWGGVFVPFDIVPDEYDRIKEAVSCATELADIVVLNAGSSKGSDDWSVEVLEEMGQIICHETTHGPGHHSSYALVNGIPIVGISGPSGGASFTLNFYLLPLMKAFPGLDPEPELIPVKLVAPFPKGNHPGARPQKPDNGTDGKTGQGSADGADNANGAPARIPGEVRPSMVTDPNAQFFSVRFLNVEADPDGTLVATPLAGHPGSAGTKSANAFYMMPSGPSQTPPEVGETIYVEMR